MQSFYYTYLTPEEKDPVVAVKILPVIDTDETFTIQVEGPTKSTTGWGIFFLHRVGGDEWLQTCVDDGFAMMLGTKLAWENGVELEIPPFMKFE